MESSHKDQVLSLLTECEQHDLLKLINEEASQDQAQALIEQVHKLDQVTPKGIKDYVERARNLLEDSKNNVNPFDDFKPEVPNGVDLKPNSKELKHYEKEGLKELTKTCFVLIAGGLGERLGYSGIKIDLPVSIIDDDYSYMRYYAEYILACRERALDYLEEGVSAESFHVPLAIMVSNDTESRTQALLDKNDYFGLNKDQVHLIKQENVPALIDNSANIAINKESMKVVTKPHGHGDIHNLLFDSKVAQKWKEQGKEWMVFIQDTNALAMKCIPSILGVSKEKGWEMNSITVPRKPGESMGAICKLVHSTDEAKSLVINVEYNVLDSLLKQKWNEKGDIPNDEGYSHFPGNINTLVFKIPEYVTNLEKTGGIIPEFVNPKYANSDRTIFKAPTRLECMMQDFPKLLSDTSKVGFTSYPTWYCFSPAKNNMKDSITCQSKGLPSFGAAQAEYDFYQWHLNVLKLLNVQIEEQTESSELNGLSWKFGPKIILDPSFALTIEEIASKIKPAHKISKGSTIILGGKDTTLGDNLQIDGTLKCRRGAKIDFFKDFDEEKIVFEPTTDEDPEVLRIRGFKAVKKQQEESQQSIQTLSTPKKERTFIMIKPDGVQRGLIGQIIARFETKGFKLVAMKQCAPGKAQFEAHYADLSSKGFFPSLIEYATSGPVVAMVWEGDNAVKTGRKMLGATKPADSEPGTIRGDLCIDVGRNIIHGSDAVESANKEIALWFKDEELCSWDHHSHSWIYE